MRLIVVFLLCLMASLPIIHDPLRVAAQKKSAAGAPRRFTIHDAEARALLAKMTLEEKLGQMTQAEVSGLKDPADVENYFLGSILSGGDGDPKSGNTLEDWTNLYDQIQARTQKTRLRIPLLYGIDALHGHNNVLGAVVFPHNIGLGCTRNPALVEKAARITAKEIRATGINWTFAPTVAVVRDERWGRTYEGFGETPEFARTLGEAAVRGYQGNDLRDPLRVLACAKHYVGDGGTVFGTSPLKRPNSNENWPLDQGDVKLSEAELKALHMQGYLSAIRAGVGTIMPSYNSWNGVKCSGSKRLLTEILKGELKFDGFLISDYNAIDALPGDYKSDIEQSVNAGMDMFMVPDKYREFYSLLRDLVKEGKIPMSRIDDAVIRILRVKIAMGLMDAKVALATDRSLHQSFGSAEHRAVARECVRQSVVLLKNNGRVLPLAKGARRIHVGGKNADDIGNQCGGWTISWQGKSGALTPGGTTILQAMKKAVSPSTQVTYQLDGGGGKGADVGVVVIGETPYAEMFGDRTDLSLDPADVNAVKQMKQAGLPVVVILISGRPLLLDSIIDDCDAILAAWLPGTEGQGVTDLLFGEYKPTGKLSYTWPRSNAQLPINVGDKNYQPLFRYGFGMTY